MRDAISDLFHPGVVKVIINLQDENMNISSFARNIEMYWARCRNIVYLLYMYNIVDFQRTGKEVKFNITNEGRLVRNSLLTINQVIGTNKQKFIARSYGYESKNELLNDIRGE